MHSSESRRDAHSRCLQHTALPKCTGTKAQFAYSCRTRRRPLSTDPRKHGGTVPACSVRRPRSSVGSCETFTTESRGRPVERGGNRTLPGTSASSGYQESFSRISTARDAMRHPPTRAGANRRSVISTRLPASWLRQKRRRLVAAGRAWRCPTPSSQSDPSRVSV